jgi:hypothetical protein
MLSTCCRGLIGGFCIVTHIQLSNAEIKSIIVNAPPYYEPLYVALRDHNLDLYIIEQNAQTLDLPRAGRPVLALIGDDTGKTVGPTGFHRTSLRRLVGWADRALIATVAAPRLYACAAAMATSFGVNVLVIETPLPAAQDWADFLTEANPQIHLTLGLCAGGRA